MIKYLKILLLLRIFIWPWNTLILIRGTPSAGKTTLATKFPFPYTDTDMYMSEGDFAERFQIAYNKHYAHLHRLFESGRTFLVPRCLPVWSSCNDYFKIADRYGYKLVVIDLTTEQSVAEAVKWNKNKATKEVVESFRKNWKAWPSVSKRQVKYLYLTRKGNKYARS